MCDYRLPTVLMPRVVQTHSSGALGSSRKVRFRNIGFVADERRINVGLTRARCSLLVVANTRALQVGGRGNGGCGVEENVGE